MQENNYPEVDNEESLTSRKHKVGLWIAAGGFLLVMLAGAAFIGGRLLQAQAPIGLMQPIGGIGVPGGEAVQGERITIELQITLAPEVPSRAPELMGTFISRDGNNIMVQQVIQGIEGPGLGGQIEVVMTGDTQIYREITQPPPIDQIQAGSGIRQVVEAVLNGDEITENTMVQVWGEKRGDRLIAQVVVYTQPMMIQRQP